MTQIEILEPTVRKCRTGSGRLICGARKPMVLYGFRQVVGGGIDQQRVHIDLVEFVALQIELIEVWHRAEQILSLFECQPLQFVSAQIKLGECRQAEEFLNPLVGGFGLRSKLTIGTD